MCCCGSRMCMCCTCVILLVIAIGMVFGFGVFKHGFHKMKESVHYANAHGRPFLALSPPPLHF